MPERSPRPTGLAWAVLVFLALAAGFGGAQLAGIGSAGQPGAPPADPAGPALARLGERISELERRLAAPGPLRTSAEPRVATTDRQPASDPQLNEALQALEARLATLERELAARPPVARPDVAAVPDPSQLADLARALAANQQRILQPATTPEEKLQAWRNLRDHEEAYTDAVVQQMVALGLSSPDPKIRADVWRQADSRSRHPGLAAAMIRALQGDADPDVREEAAETLGNYTGRADVVQALTWARNQDTDPKVRRFAAQSLEGGDRRRR